MREKSKKCSKIKENKKTNLHCVEYFNADDKQF